MEAFDQNVSDLDPCGQTFDVSGDTCGPYPIHGLARLSFI